MPKLTLFFRPFCPFCRKVLDYISQERIEIPLKDVGDDSNQRELIKLGGKAQVPCLIIDDQALYESGDIIEWLGENCR